MPTLVTGATGFLGNHLVRALLRQGERVRALVRPETNPRELLDIPVEIAWGNLTQAETIKAAMRGVERVYHAAAKVEIGARRDGGMSELNVEGTRNVLEAAWRSGVERVVYTSSVAVIGAGGIHQRLTEDDVYTGRGIRLPYAWSKVLADRVVMRFVKRGLPVVPVYPTLFMGAGDKYLNTAKPILRYLEGRAIGCIAGGFGCSDVRDIADGHVLAMQRGQPGRRYILGGWNITVRQFYGFLERITRIPAPNLRLPSSLAYLIAAFTEWIEPIRGKPPLVTVGDVNSARLYWFYNYSRAREELGLKCRPLIESLSDTVAWLAPRVIRSKGRSHRRQPIGHPPNYHVEQYTERRASVGI
jgi:dihydroflavonol-4-reductase